MPETYQYESLRLEPLAHSIQAEALVDVLGAVAKRLAQSSNAASIGIVAIDGPQCRRFRIDPQGKAEQRSERFGKDDCDAAVVITADALADVLTGELSPFEALASRQLRYAGNTKALMSVVAILAGLPENSVPAPCDEAAS